MVDFFGPFYDIDFRLDVDLHEHWMISGQLGKSNCVRLLCLLRFRILFHEFGQKHHMLFDPGITSDFEGI